MPSREPVVSSRSLYDAGAIENAALLKSFVACKWRRNLSKCYLVILAFKDFYSFNSSLPLIVEERLVNDQ